MRILIATGIYPPDIGGPATYSKELADELIRQGHTVVVITYGGKKELGLVTVSRQLPKGIRHFIYFLKVLRNAIHADIIYAQDPVSVGLPASFAAWFLRKKFVVRIAGDYAWEQGVGRFGVKELLDDFLKLRYGFRVELLRWCQQLVARSADLVIVPSEYLKEVVLRWGLKNKNIEVVFSVAQRVGKISKEDARASLGLDGKVFVSAGRLVSWKGFKMLIELMPKLLPAKLIILGDGPERAALEALRDRLKLADSVLLLGAVSKEVLVQYVTAADVFLLNTGYEGYSHQLLESMAIGTPVVTTSAGGNKELVDDNINALVAEYNNLSEWEIQIKKILNDDMFAKKISQEAQRQVEGHTFKDMTKKLIMIFEQL